MCKGPEVIRKACAHEPTELGVNLPRRKIRVVVGISWGQISKSSTVQDRDCLSIQPAIISF